ncbi:Acetate kinase [Desulfovibrio sp. X2]|uniref:acetate kinase n=1 Tax=Desulfovibrio sp. X2 TaxID=941449 RepID=UPI000358CD7A|nr:acetate kinase [Desulfovibrio sp. X2]EPR39879.1 Acetate kinase [Desulfovibrio sp. X2]
MKILVLNSGSSSLKYQLLDMDSTTVLTTGLVERIGESIGAVRHKRFPGSPKEESFSYEMPIKDHAFGLTKVMDLIVAKDTGVLENISDVDAIGHRVVQGGDLFSQPMLVDDSVVEGIRKLIPLGPLHNPGHLAGIETARKLLPGVPNVVVFDTAFHQTMAPEAYRYAIPKEYYTELKIRRYGFHGTSHGYVAKQCAKLLGKPFSETSCITVHLGNGCSMDAVKNGKCIDTSMGLTPLGGLVMGTRCGDIDPAVIAFLASNKGLTAEEIDTILNKQSGLKGLCGYNDMRDIHARVSEGDADAELALKVFCRRVTQFIGQDLAVLGGCDAICFTAGIGENDAVVRQLACATLAPLGAVIDSDKNMHAPRGQAVEISAAGSPIKIFIIPTNEELEIATETLEVLRNQ